MKKILSAAIGLMILAPVALHAEPPPHAGVWKHKKHHVERHYDDREWRRERHRRAHRQHEHHVYREYHYHGDHYHRHERPRRRTESSFVIHLDL